MFKRLHSRPMTKSSVVGSEEMTEDVSTDEGAPDGVVDVPTATVTIPDALEGPRPESTLTIGKIERVPLREVWRHEAHNLTVWLEENIDVLHYWRRLWALHSLPWHTPSFAASRSKPPT
jgi:hypothetical protein